MTGSSCWPIWWWYRENAKCEMLRKIDGEMNVQNCGYSAKLRNGDGGDMLHDWRQQQLSRTRAIVFWRDDTLPTSKTLSATTRQPWWSIEFRKYRMYLQNLRLFTSVRSRLLFHGWRSGSCHAPVPLYFEEMTRCHVKDFTGDDQATLTIDRNSTI